MRKHWSKVRLGELLQPISRPEVVDPTATYSILGAHWYAKGLYTKDVLPGSGIQSRYVYRVKWGDFVYNRLFGWKGSFAIATEENDDCYVSNEFPCFEIRGELLDGVYLSSYFSLPTVWEEVLGLSTGGTPTSRNRLKEERLLAIEIPLPPLSEQQRIVARIEALAANIHEACALRKQATDEVGMLTRAAARELLYNIPNEPTPLGRWLHPQREGIQTGPFGAQLSSTEFTEAGTPILTIGNIQYFGLDLANLKFVSQEKANQLSRYQVQENDILFARMGTVGRCCVVPKRSNGWLINYHIIRVALDTTRVDPRFIHWTIQASADIEEYLEDKIRGATREGVNSKIVRELPCRIPPLPEQRRIVAYLDDLQDKADVLKKLQVETSAELDALMPSILDKAFRGEL